MVRAKQRYKVWLRSAIAILALVLVHMSSERIHVVSKELFDRPEKIVCSGGCVQ